ncbi:S8 family serine peptidase, partial [Bacillus sp. S34]|nr:S8 family serine peptidase [Bacillus sp. S34]
TGDGRLSMSGTSMATPDVAGIAALTFQSHPTWSAPQVKAALMNTATHDVEDGDGTIVTLTQGPFPEVMRDMNIAGWTQSFHKLEALLATPKEFFQAP